MMKYLFITIINIFIVTHPMEEFAYSENHLTNLLDFPSFDLAQYSIEEIPQTENNACVEKHIIEIPSTIHQTNLDTVINASLDQKENETNKTPQKLNMKKKFLNKKDITDDAHYFFRCDSCNTEFKSPSKQLFDSQRVHHASKCFSNGKIILPKATIHYVIKCPYCDYAKEHKNLWDSISAAKDRFRRKHLYKKHPETGSQKNIDSHMHFIGYAGAFPNRMK